VTRGFEAMAEAVKLEGVEVVFGVLGATNDRMVHELVSTQGIRFIAARHEQGAVGMADGYSRATGKVGVATVEKGPGLTNTGTAMTTARLSGSRVLLIAGDKVAGSRLGNMDIEQPPFILATAGAMQQVNTPETLADEVRLGFRHVRLGLGPMVLNVPMSVSESELPDGWRYEPSSASLLSTQAAPPARERVEAVAQLLRESERPVILAGRGAFESGARDALVELADRVGGVLVTSLAAKGLFRGHPYDLGISGGFAPSQARAILNEADLVLAFGAGVNLYTTDHGRLYPEATIVQIDVNPSRIGAIAPVDEAVIADARAAAEALLEAFGSEPRSGWRGEELAAEIAAVDRWADCDFEERAGYVNRHELVRVCEETLPEDRVLAVGIGHFMGMPTAHITVPTPQHLVLPWRLGAIGSGLPVAVGAAVGRPESTVVLFEGDGSFMMTLQDFETAVRCSIPLLVIIENDQGHGSERRTMMRRGDSPELANFANPSFAEIARAFGGDGYTVDGAEELRRVLESVGRPERPTLIDVAISPTEADVRMAYVRTGGPV
jgi:acetolactate synthase I/II/III large subunit